MEVVEGRQLPPSRVSSEGGSRVVERQPPPSRVSSEGGSRVVVKGKQLNPTYFLCRVVRLNTANRKKNEPF